MLILLPPSEGKTAPAVGAPVDLWALAFAPELTVARERVLRALVRTCSGRTATALKALDLSPGQAGEVERNAGLEAAPAAPAAEIYTGVLYERLRFGELSPEARGRAADSVLIASALWGVVRPDDRIPAYKLSMGAKLGRLGPLAALWRAPLRRALPDEGLVVDMRSGSYSAAWKPKHGTLLAVRAFTEQPDGSRKPISHMAKAARGDVTRILLEAPEPPATPDAAAGIVRAAGLRVELQPGFLDVIG